MPVRAVPHLDLKYHLIVFDEDGRERPESDGSMLSAEVLQLVAEDGPEAVTDVFLMSHGWQGDIPAAIEQYDRWLTAVAAQDHDRAAARSLKPGFRSLIVGLHWPSRPWGDENVSGNGGLLSGEDDLDAELAQIEAAGIAATPAAKDALRTIADAARGTTDAVSLSPRVLNAYRVLYAESGLVPPAAPAPQRAATAPPGLDQEGFDPAAIIQEAQAQTQTGAAPAGPGLLGGGPIARIKDLLLMPVRQLSFWKMKDRARRFGEGGAHDLVRAIQAADNEVDLHLMGHSFGCIVVSAAIAGASAGRPLVRPVESLFLVQGALSLWSMSPAVPFSPFEAGYFLAIRANHLVLGPVVTTRSTHDIAVGVFYPRGAQVKKQLVLDEPPRFPRYGGVGAFGLQGLTPEAEEFPMQPATFAYPFQPGNVYNLEASGVINKGGGFSGAHSDIAHPQVAHAMWQAVLSGMRARR